MGEGEEAEGAIFLLRLHFLAADGGVGPSLALCKVLDEADGEGEEALSFLVGAPKGGSRGTCWAALLLPTLAEAEGVTTL